MHESSTTPARFVRFGNFVLDVRARELARDGVRLNVPEQPLQVLEALLEISRPTRALLVPLADAERSDGDATSLADCDLMVEEPRR